LLVPVRIVAVEEFDREFLHFDRRYLAGFPGRGQLDRLSMTVSYSGDTKNGTE
jgi:hypothetical protein